MRTLVLVLLASVLCLDGWPAGAQKAGQDPGFKVYRKFVDGETLIYMSNLDGSGERKLTEGYYPALSPDRKHLVFVRRSDLYLMDLGTMKETLLLDRTKIDVNSGVAVPRWHPDGRRIFFDFTNAGFWIDLYSIQMDGTNLRLLMEQASLSFESWPSPFSPDGHYLLYTDCFDGCYTLLIFDLDAAAGANATSPTRTYLSKRTNYGAWSPDGRHIAFGDAWGPGLSVADVLGKARQILDDVEVGALSWSADSQRIGFTRRDEEAAGASGAIYEVGLDGTGLQARAAHFDAWEYVPDSTTVPATSEKTWGQVKQEQSSRGEG